MRNEEFTQQALETTIKLGVVAILAVWCYQIVQPFIHTILWGIIIAVAVFPLYRQLRAGLGERAGLAAAVMTIVLLVIMVLPVILLISLTADNLQVLSQHFRDGTLRVPPPPPEIASWPVVGAPIHGFWHLAASNLSAAVQQLAPQLKEVAGPLLAAAAAVGLSMVQFTLGGILAGFFLAYSEEGYELSRTIGKRLAGEQGVESGFVGGAGIVAAHAAGLGAMPTLISVVGDDSESDYARQTLEKSGVRVEFLLDDTRPTTLKTRYRCRGKTRAPRVGRAPGRS